MRAPPVIKPRRGQRGLSLVELMVAMVVGLLILGGLIQVYLSGKQSYNAQERLARMQESGRLGMDLITRDLRRAGYWGGNVDLTTITGSPGPAAPAHACDGTNTWGRMVNWRVSGRNNTNAGYGCAAGYLPNTDILTIRYTGPNLVADADVPANGGLYMRSDMFLGWVMTGSEKESGENNLPAGLPIPPAHLVPVVRRLVSNAYYVGDSGRTCPGGQAIPALMRVALDLPSGLPVTEEIATGVEQLQVRYLLDDAYVDAGAVDAADGWRDVTAVRVWLLVRGECPEGGIQNTTSYVMGDTVLDANDNFRRQLYISTVMLRNNRVR